MESIRILGVPVHNLTKEEVLSRLEKMVESGRSHQVVTVNPEFLVLARNNKEFHKLLTEADLALVDGAGLQLAALLQGRHFASRIPGSELIHFLAPKAVKKGWRFFFLGAAPGVARKAAEKLQLLYPGIKVSVSEADPTAEGTKAALSSIRETQPHILLVAYGAPTQDLWIARHREEIKVPLMIGVGGTLDYLAGTAVRPPKGVSNLGLEWLYRLIKQPWRWRRQLRLPIFVFLILLERAVETFQGRRDIAPSNEVSSGKS
jgi:N-acetylglucosaminyldiphosphoundecaprenol N-acetyl-beta-D-mannosaminyltransferase